MISQASFCEIARRCCGAMRVSQGHTFRPRLDWLTSAIKVVTAKRQQQNIIRILSSLFNHMTILDLNGPAIISIISANTNNARQLKFRGIERRAAEYPDANNTNFHTDVHNALIVVICPILLVSIRKHCHSV